MKSSPFFKQASVMLQCIPAVNEEKVFALKGGTAINMFVRPMPRLSVDIDLTYVPIEDRTASMDKMTKALENIAKNIERTIRGAKVLRTKKSGQIIKLVVSIENSQIKIEPNYVLRGTLADPVSTDLVKEAEELFGFNVTIPVVSAADLYGGKICAALDRQHPRDLFDIKILFENQGITDDIRKGFLVYLASHDRPIHEVVRPTLKDISEIYKNEFVDMAPVTPPLDELYAARENLLDTIHAGLTADERSFLISLKSGDPDWKLLGVPNAEKLPGIQWKLMNIKRMSPEKRKEQLEKLRERIFD